MAEYIDRNALIEHIRKDPLFDLVEQYGITGVIESFPTADVQPVVRCINCKYYEGLACCKLIGDCGGTNWFCGWGEPKEE